MGWSQVLDVGLDGRQAGCDARLDDLDLNLSQMLTALFLLFDLAVGLGRESSQGGRARSGGVAGGASLDIRDIGDISFNSRRVGALGSAVSARGLGEGAGWMVGRRTRRNAS